MDKKILFLTGSSGALGRELLNFYLAKFDIFVLFGRNTTVLDQQKLKIEGYNKKCILVILDFCDLEALETECLKIIGEKLYPDLLINCAGVGFKNLAVSDNHKQIDVIKINTMALTKLTLMFLPYMQKEKKGDIINVASVAAFQPSPGVTVYAATKAFVYSFSMALQAECFGTGVRVFTLAPGPFVDESQYDEAIKKPGLFRKYRTHTTREIVQALETQRQKGVSLEIPGLINKLMAYLSRVVSIKLIMKLAPYFVYGKKASAIK